MKVIGVPTWLAARGKPPIPSNKLPIVKLTATSLPKHFRFELREPHLE